MHQIDREAAHTQVGIQGAVGDRDGGASRPIDIAVVQVDVNAAAAHRIRHGAGRRVTAERAVEDHQLGMRLVVEGARENGAAGVAGSLVAVEHAGADDRARQAGRIRRATVEVEVIDGPAAPKSVPRHVVSQGAADHGQDRVRTRVERAVADGAAVRGRGGVREKAAVLDSDGACPVREHIVIYAAAAAEGGMRGITLHQAIHDQQVGRAVIGLIVDAAPIVTGGIAEHRHIAQGQAALVVVDGAAPTRRVAVAHGEAREREADAR